MVPLDVGPPAAAWRPKTDPFAVMIAQSSAALAARQAAPLAPAAAPLSGDFGKSAKLPEGETVPVEFLPKEPGTYEFMCGIAMLRGRVVVEPRGTTKEDGER